MVNVALTRGHGGRDGYGVRAIEELDDSRSSGQSLMAVIVTDCPNGGGIGGRG